MANTRGDLLIFVLPGSGGKPIGKVYVAVGGTDGSAWILQSLDKSPGDLVGGVLAADFTGAKAVHAIAPGGAPAVGSFVGVAGYELPNRAPSPQVAFIVIDYITTPDTGATKFALLASSEDPTTRIAVPFADIAPARN